MDTTRCHLGSGHNMICRSEVQALFQEDTTRLLIESSSPVGTDIGSILAASLRTAQDEGTPADTQTSL